MRFRIDLQYDGTAYHGWQIQPNSNTVEETIERSLSLILRKNIDLIGCGRTDTGVHAKFFTAHFDFDSELHPIDLIHKLRNILPSDIGILGISQVPEDFHARFSALSRSYVYCIQFTNNSFLHKYACLISAELEVHLMNQSCKDLIGEHSFSAFCKGHPSGDHYLCTVSRAQWQHTENGLEFHITANRFLRNMVRAIVGTQLDIGRGKLSLSEHRQLILGGKRSEAGISVPAKGLFLTAVNY